jgi:hypothetical protein
VVKLDGEYWTVVTWDPDGEWPQDLRIYPARVEDTEETQEDLDKLLDLVRENVKRWNDNPVCKSKQTMVRIRVEEI